MADRKEPPIYNDDSVGAFQYKLPFYETMELFIETLTGTCFELRVSPFETVISVKAKIQRLEGIPVAQQHLIWNNLELEDEYCLHDYSIAEGCTLKLVLAMRGGPINTRRVSVEDPVKDMAELMEGGREEGWEKSMSSNKQVTFLVYREGDQLNFFRVVDRGDGTLTPVSESFSGGSVYNMFSEEEDNDSEGLPLVQPTLENCITMNKMKLLKAKMEDMNINKKPKKSAKLEPLPPVGPRPCSSSLDPSGSRHHRLFRVLPEINQSHHSASHLPPIRDQGSITPSPPAAASASTHLSSSGRALPYLSSSSCYMLQEEEPWESIPKSIRPPPKVSRLEIGSARLMRDCVYPQLPVLSSRGQVGGATELPDPRRESLGLGLLEEAVGLLEPTPPRALYGGDLLSDPLSLDISSQPEMDLGGLDGPGALGVGAELQLPSTPSLLSQAVGMNSLNNWAMVGSDRLAWKGERTPLLGNTLHHIPDSPSSSSCPSSRPRLPQPFEFSGSTTSPLRPNIHSSSHPRTFLTPPPPTSPSSPPHGSRLRGINVDSRGKWPEMISKSEACGITKLANQACKEPLGSLRNTELLASLSSSRSLGSSRGVLEPSLGIGLGLPAVGASGLGTLGSTALSLPANIQLLQEDLIRRAATSYMSTNSLGSAGGSSSIRRLGTPTYHLPPVKVPLSRKKKSSKHCFLCGKKTGLATSYECRCGNNFCATHRYAETHDCTYNYKSAGRRFLQETNPIVNAPKLPKI
uniref:AN1-type zinc finger protein 4-like n=1 Tax=Oncorhynchus gorbuscha TaxID=8017 RepID=UPI001EAF08D0|nr:AN1-type zinc finger protein 4-like [Oncorhynchus gorbuscha]XP_046190555.1 AN1-type zinc finger protein 4-like [Oncorhynchus gorbuscha]XP_046190556.1 AN1-type zinc finger protein 4-like [Oncorhynchus gorbuscha]XP_046190557.1 AN1-type zinc finger protein 4-like [Oncorhynchus gorbuscha]XP_046190559.1 AN1-type zinc finger protein 4-like [Oncorhynchus gorbuscha]XP_046190560.1 AN1-type zinc finger protein 4-like [Oncorhynchus gorbuscha]